MWKSSKKKITKTKNLNPEQPTTTNQQNSMKTKTKKLKSIATHSHKLTKFHKQFWGFDLLNLLLARYICLRFVNDPRSRGISPEIWFPFNISANKEVNFPNSFDSFPTNRLKEGSSTWTWMEFPILVDMPPLILFLAIRRVQSCGHLLQLWENSP